MNIDPLTLESQFEVTKLKLYLQENPTDSHRLAISHYEDFLTLVQEYRKLYQKYELLHSEYSEFIDLLTTIPDRDFTSKNSSN